MSGAEFEEQSSALVIGVPAGGSVDEGFGEDDNVSGFHFGLGDVVCRALEIAYLFGKVQGQVGFVRSGDAGESPVAFFCGREIIGEHCEAVAHDAVSIFVPVVARAFGCIFGVAAVEGSPLGTFFHENGVVVIGAKFGAEEFDQIGYDIGVVEKILAEGVPLGDSVAASEALLVYSLGKTRSAISLRR